MRALGISVFQERVIADFAMRDNRAVMYEKSELFSITEGNVGLGGLTFRKMSY